MSAETKAIVTVTEMARMCGLSRARFYQLIGSTFPWPIYRVATRRPFYDEELQKICLEVRRRNCGIDGKPVLFYSCGPAPRPAVQRATKSKTAPKHTDLIASLVGLGLTGVTEQQVEDALVALYPKGVGNVDETTRLRAIFVHLMGSGRRDR